MMRDTMQPYYSANGIQIWLGDCRDVLPHISGDLIVADYPYGEKQADWDGEKPDSIVWDLMHAALPVGGVLYYWGFWGHADWVLPHARRVGFTPQSQITWWFRTGRPEKLSFREDKEIAWYFSKGEPRVFNPGEDLEPYEDEANYARYGRKGKHPGTVWQASRIFHNHPQNIGHETQKPEEIIAKMVRISSNPGDTVIDPTFGSGTTLRVAKNLGRRCIGIEKQEKWCEAAAIRLSQEVMALI
jgi:site-specific DNA-methyltransferase (adenine-specific)